MIYLKVFELAELKMFIVFRRSKQLVQYCLRMFLPRASALDSECYFCADLAHQFMSQINRIDHRHLEKAETVVPAERSLRGAIWLRNRRAFAVLRQDFARPH